MTSSVPHRKESTLTDQVQNCAGFRLSLFGGPRLEQGERQLRLSPLQSALLGIVATCGRSGIPRGRLLSLLLGMQPRFDKKPFSVMRTAVRRAPVGVRV